MCRLVLMNKEGEKEIDSQYGLENYFQYLEQQLGGHGNGYSLLKNGRIIKTEKGINLNIRDIADVMKKTNYDWAIFHTRLASVGSRCDKNCHPFRRNNTVLAMNGTEQSVSFVSDSTDMTDTETILDLISKYHLELMVLRRFNSIFVGFHKGSPFVVANNTYNLKMLKNGYKKAIVFASSFPSVFENIYEPSHEFLWQGGKLPYCLKKHKQRKPIFFNDYIYHNDLYEQCYFEVSNKKGGKVA